MDDAPRHRTDLSRQRDWVVSALALRKYIRYLESLGLPSQIALDTADLTETQARDPEAKISYRAFCRVSHLVAERTSSSNIGLALASHASLNDLDVVGRVIELAPTVGDALVRLERYYRLHTNGSEFVNHDEGDAFTLEFVNRCRDAELTRHDDEFSLAMAVRVASALAGRSLPVQGVSFRHDGSPSREHLEAFGVAPEFGGDRVAVTFAKAALAWPTVTSTSRISPVIESYAESLLQQTKLEPTLLDAIGLELEALVRQGELGIHELAKRLQMSARTLQRTLADHGTTYRDLLDRVRHEQAVQYLHEVNLGQAEIAFLLGFSEVSAYLRAFKRWEGTTPSAFRQIRLANFPSTG